MNEIVAHPALAPRRKKSDSFELHILHTLARDVQQ
jgi:hypothetical protein